MADKSLEAILSRQYPGMFEHRQGRLIIPTGILSLDLALGTGGFVGGRMGLTWGDQGTGKTMLGLCTIARIQELQRRQYEDFIGKKCAILDVEGALDEDFMRACGVDPNDPNLLWISGRDLTSGIKELDGRPLTGEEWFDITNQLIRSGEIIYIMKDSITALVPAQIMKSKTVDQAAKKAALAQLTSAQLQVTNAEIQRQPGCYLNLVAQSRQKPMVMFGPSEQASGGTAPSFYGTYVFRVKRIKQYWAKYFIDEDSKAIEKEVAVDIRLLIEKNKTAAKSEPIEFHVDFGTGVDVIDDLVKTARHLAVIKTDSSYLSYGDIRANGVVKFKEALDPDVIETIRQETLNKMKLVLQGGPASVSEEEPEE